MYSIKPTKPPLALSCYIHKTKALINCHCLLLFLLHIAHILSNYNHTRFYIFLWKSLFCMGVGMIVRDSYAFRFKVHEEKVGAIALEMGFSHVSLSSHVIPMVKAVPRGFTASSDAYLTPHIKAYLKVVFLCTIVVVFKH